MHNNDLPIAIVLGLSPTGLSVARSLSYHGVPVYGIDVRRWEVGHFSRHVRRENDRCYLGPGEELLEYLVDFSGKHLNRPVLYACADNYVEFLIKNANVLKDHFILPRSYSDGVASSLLDKAAFAHLCENNNIVRPATYWPTSIDDVNEIVQRITYPVIVKPILSHQIRNILHGEKLVEVSNETQLMYWWNLLNKQGCPSVIQECVVGPESNIGVAALYVDMEGRCVSLFTGRKLRQYPPMFGSGSYVISEWIPEIADISRNLMCGIGYHGLCGTEFKWDERDHKWKIIEVNCRAVQWYSLTRYAGVDVAWTSYCDLSGKGNIVQTCEQKNGVKWQLFVRDVVSASILARRHEISLKELVHTVFNPFGKTEAVVVWDDPKSIIGYVINTIGHIRNNRGTK